MGADAAAVEQFGPYLVYERLGVGGMATVHRALERGIEGFERTVALKRLLPHLAADASFIKSFVREAKLAAFLKHVNIVQLFELGRVGTAYFISMEYIDGRDIRRILRHARKVSGPPPIHVTVGLLLQLCDALDYAHSKTDDNGHPLGLVHRDVSPSNVLVTSAGQVKVIDFGIAKAQSAQLRTQTGRVKGKLAYMAPEALAGKDLDARSDLFAAGVIAHELLTARPLFATKNEYQTLMKLQRGEVVPPSTYNQGCPPELDALVMRALARDPDDRFAHAAELRDQLHALRRQYGLPTTERDIVTWIDWAFSLEPPSSGFTANHELDASSDLIDLASPRRAAARPRKSDDEEADVAWGDGDDQNNGQPVLLDDVPDVSAKYQSAASALGAEVRLDLDDLVDDMPTPAPYRSSALARPSDPVDNATVPMLPSSRGGGSRPGIRIRPSTQAPAAPVPPALSMFDTPAPIPVRDNPSAAVRIPPAASAPPPTASSAPAAPPPVPPPGGAIGANVRAVMIPPRARSISSPPRIVPAASTPPRTVPSLSPPPAVSQQTLPLPALSPSPALRSPSATPQSPSPALPSSDSAPTPPRGVPATVSTRSAVSPAVSISARGAAPAAGRAPAAITPGRGVSPWAPPRKDNDPTAPFPSTELTPRPDGSSTERTPLLAFDDLALPYDTVPSLPALRTPESSSPLPTVRAPESSSPLPTMRTTESVVRFRPTAPPATAAAPPSPPASGAYAAPPASGAYAPGSHPSLATPTVRASSASPIRPSAEPLHQARLVTPATELFAEPDPPTITERNTPEPMTVLTVAGAPAVASPPRWSTVSPSSSASTTRVDGSTRRLWIIRGALVLAAMIVVAAGTVVATHYLAQAQEAVTPIVAAPSAPPGVPLVKVRLVVTPSDASITIEGIPAHTGAPWEVQLTPGVHQIEITRPGFKGWLTSIDVAAGQPQPVPVQVALEPIGAVIAADATLMVGEPIGLDVILDGAQVARTPCRLPIKLGQHTVVLQRDGATVWTKDFAAKASAVYEYRPVISEPAAAAATEPASGSALAADSSPPPSAAAASPAPSADPPGTPSGSAASITATASANSTGSAAPAQHAKPHTDSSPATSTAPKLKAPAPHAQPHAPPATEPAQLSNSATPAAPAAPAPTDSPSNPAPAQPDSPQ